MELDFGVNQGFVEEQYFRYRENPSAVDMSWRRFFEALEREQADGPALSLAPAGIEHAEPAHATPQSAEAKAPNGNGRSHGANGGRNGNGNGRMTAALPATAESVPSSMPQAGGAPNADVLLANELQGRVSALVNAYRVRGHVYADLDPLNRNPPMTTELSLAAFGLDQVDPSALFFTGDMAGPTTLPLHDRFPAA